MKRLLSLSLVVAAMLPMLYAARPAAAQGSAIEVQVSLLITDPSGRIVTVFFRGDVIILKCQAPPGKKCFDERTRIRIRFFSDPVTLARMTADDQGRYDTTGMNLRIPMDADPGPHTVAAEGVLDGRPVTYTQAITVLAREGEGGGVIGGGGAGFAPLAAPALGGGIAPLPKTGKEIILFVLWGTVLLFGGVLLIAYTTRRYRAARANPVPLPGTDQGMFEAEDDVTAFLRELDEDREPELAPVGARTAEAEPPAVVAPEPEVRPAPPPVPALAKDEVEDAIRRAAARTSDLVARLQDEVKAWRGSDEAAERAER